MKLSKKVAGLLLGLGLVGGTTAAIGLQTHAQTVPTPVPAAVEAPGTETSDTAADAASEAQEAPGTEANDANEPAGGHEDPAGANVDHQFEGVE